MDDHGGALAFIAWRLSLEGAKALHGEGFDYLSDHERVGVICEFVAFALQLADRTASEVVDEAHRDALINALAHRLSDHMQDNLQDLAGPGAYREPFIALMNTRLEDYAAFVAQDGEPGFLALRYFGHQVMAVMGESQTNRWLVDQVVTVSAPEIVTRFGKAVSDILATG